ncbi:MAG: hypothetical protein H0T47_06605 [Planctomycetaceae bacterium]|nr:hypothetical protein [Planctomycetaceae bacterium]
MTTFRLRLALAAAVLFVAPVTIAFDQTPEIEAAKANAVKAAEAARANGGKPGGPTPAGQPMPGQPAPGGQPTPGQPMGDKPAEATPPAVVSRPPKPAFEVDPKELDIKPIDGKVRFNFHGQPWQGVLEWMASVSGLSLDWQELPGDHLNLRTQRDYTLDEARDLLNQHLLARGYTMLRHGEVVTVVNLAKLDPALVPTVEPSELKDRDAHEFVQTVFALDWMPAQTAEEELKPLLSPKGKLAKLTTTNRLHALDVVANLRAIHALLTEEQSGRGRERLVKSFKLEYARADEVKKLLEEFLGLDKKGPAMPMDPNQARMMQQQMQQMQQQQGGQPAPPGPKQDAEISIISNPRDNEVIAQAPPETMAVIEQTIELLDAPSDTRESLDRQLSKYRVFRLSQIDPETLVTMLTEMGGLDPRTKLTADKKNHSLIVNGSLVDHVVVQQVVERLDGSDRQFDVIRLRRLPADYVAGTIRFMMGGEEEKKDDNSFRRYYYYDPFGSNNNEKEAASTKFRVDADVENNRLLLYANELELEEIQKLLVKLGEIRPSDGQRSTVRVLNVSGEQADEFLRRLQENWGAGKSHPLVIEPSAEPPKAAPPTGDPFAPKEVPTLLEPKLDGPGPADAAKPTITTSHASTDEFLLALNDEIPGATPNRSESQPEPEPELGREVPPREVAPPRSEVPFGFEGFPSKSQMPVKVTRAPDGRLIVTSDDPRALDAVEDLMYEFAPPPKDYHIFHLKYASTYSYYVVYNLEDYFGVDEKDNKSDDNFRSYYYGYPPPSSGGSDDVTRLSQRRKLKFIPDEDSRTILVQGASPEQLKTIADLIEIYDTPISQNSGDLRITKLFHIKHAQAETIANAVKDVYRDLLSSNDKALQAGQNAQGEKPPVAERSYTYVLGGGGDKGKEPEAPIKFKGLLSIGIDKDSNTLVISASTSLLNEVGKLIDSLDLAAKEKEAVSVVRTGSGGALPAGVSGRLKEIFGDKIKIVGQDDATTTSDASTIVPGEARR